MSSGLQFSECEGMKRCVVRIMSRSDMHEGKFMVDGIMCFDYLLVAGTGIFID